MLTKQPAATVGLVTTLIGIAIAVARSLGWHIGPDQEQALLKMCVVGLPLITAIVIHGLAWAPASVRRAIEAGYVAGTQGAPLPTADSLTLPAGTFFPASLGSQTAPVPAASPPASSSASDAAAAPATLVTPAVPEPPAPAPFAPADATLTGA